MVEARQQATAELSEAIASVYIAWAAVSDKTFAVMVLAAVVVDSSSCTFAVIVAAAEFYLIAVCDSCGASLAGAVRPALVISLVRVLVPRHADSYAQAFLHFCSVS